MRSQLNQFNLGTLQIYPPQYHTAYCSNVSTFTLSFLRNIQRRIVMQISLLVCNIYIYIEIPKTDIMRSQLNQFNLGTLQIYPPSIILHTVAM